MFIIAAWIVAALLVLVGGVWTLFNHLNGPILEAEVKALRAGVSALGESQGESDGPSLIYLAEAEASRFANERNRPKVRIAFAIGLVMLAALIRYSFLS